jgi:glutamine amidotransferase
MCQLLGISSNKEVNLCFSFREWRHRGGKKNPDGYGFAYWPGGIPRVLKHPTELEDSPAKPGVEEVKQARSRTFVCHVRWASAGTIDGTNTHPFEAEHRGRRFVFAHNGTVREVRNLPAFRLGHRKPKGQTDSEHAFLWLLENLPGSDEPEFALRLREYADQVRQRGKFNFLLSDGETLWAYADDSLSYVERTPPYGGHLVTLVEDRYSISLEEVKTPDERAILVATRPLSTEEEWHGLRQGELLIIRAGRVADRPLPR